MSNFRARIIAELDTSKIESKLKTQIGNKKIILHNFSLDTKGLGSKIQQALNGYHFTLNLTNVRVDNLSRTIEGQLSSAGQKGGQALVRRINEQMSSGALQTSIDKMTAQYNKLFAFGQGNSQIHAQLTMANNDLKLLNTLQAQINTSSSNSELVSNYQKFEVVLARVRNNLQSVSAQSRTFASSLQVSTLDNRIATWMEKNTRAARDFGSGVQELRNRLAELNASGGATTAQLNAIEREFNEIRQAAIAAGKSGQSFGTIFRASFNVISRYISASLLIYRAIAAFKEMYQNVLNVDTAMTALKRVTQLTNEEYKDLYANMIGYAQKYGSTLKDIIDLTTSWVKLGYTPDTATQLAGVTTTYQHVTDIDTETATKHLITAYKGFQNELNQAFQGDTVKAVEYISDIYDKLNNEYAVTASDIGNAMQRSASALSMAGNTIQESTALATGMNEVIQNAEKTGTVLQVTSLRLRGMKGELEELGEDVDENVESLSQMQTHVLNLTNGKVNIFQDNGDFKSTYDIFKEISKIYYDLSDTSRADLLETISGKRNANAVGALISNWEQVEKAMESATNAEGTSAQENEKYMESMQGHLNQLQTVWESFSNNVLDSDFLKGLIDGGKTILGFLETIIDKIGLIPALIIGIGAAMSFKNVGRTKMFVLNGG